MPRPTVCLALLGVLLASALVQAQYPPGQYPPGQYPPNTNPNTYPARLPGGIPVNLPIPEIKLPKKNPKEKAEKTGKAEDELKVTLSPVDGLLRKLGEKDLFLQTGNNTVLRFRLLAKTQFRDKAGVQVRDSLLHPGDRLTVEVNTDDEETAIRVIVLRKGTAAERSAAERPIEQSATRAPTAEDLGKPRTVSVRESNPAETERGPEPETGAVTATSERPATNTNQPAARNADVSHESDDQIIAGARTAAASFSSSLPNFLAEQVTTRNYKLAGVEGWRAIDVVTAEVAYQEGTESYGNIRVDGAPVNRPPERSGSWTTGEFGSTLEDVLSPATNAAFKRRGEVRIAGRTEIVYDYTVQQSNSHWTLVAPDQRRYSPAYNGVLWIDIETGRVLRLEQRATSIPADFAYSSAESILDYGFSTIGDNRYLLPASGENVACMNGSGTCSRNVIVFRNYRKFGAESVVKFKFASDTRPPER